MASNTGTQGTPLANLETVGGEAREFPCYQEYYLRFNVMHAV